MIALGPTQIGFAAIAADKPVPLENSPPKRLKLSLRMGTIEFANFPLARRPPRQAPADERSIVGIAHAAFLRSGIATT
jgi:hypothetical protein